jgi:DNA-binding MarR family transcriptional regulator
MGDGANHSNGLVTTGSPRIDDLAARFNDAPDLPWMLAAAAVLQTYKVMSKRVEAVLGDYDLSMSRFEILGFLARSDGGRMRAKDLKDATFLHPPTMTYTLDWLEERDLVKRHPSETDRRSVTVGITAKGRKLFARAEAALSKIHHGMLGVERDDALAVARVLARSQQD